MTATGPSPCPFRSSDEWLDSAHPRHRRMDHRITAYDPKAEVRTEAVPPGSGSLIGTKSEHISDGRASDVLAAANLAEARNGCRSACLLPACFFELESKNIKWLTLISFCLARARARDGRIDPCRRQATEDLTSSYRCVARQGAPLQQERAKGRIRLAPFAHDRVAQGADPADVDLDRVAVLQIARPAVGAHPHHIAGIERQVL
jgi:hypothetical protein